MTPEFFNQALILSFLSAETQSKLSKLEILAEVNSTNQYLLDKTKLGATSGYVCLAEKQTQGRGRQGKFWIATDYSNIACSILWHFSVPIIQLSGLSLALGVAAIRTLRKYGITEAVGVKWPNDIYAASKKLAGILVEIAEHKSDSCKIVVGIGINLDLFLAANIIDQPWIDIKTITGQIPKRNELTALLINEFFTVLSNFAHKGFKNYRKEWLEYDVTLGKHVKIFSQGQFLIKGIIQDISNQGEIIVKSEQGIIKTFSNGEISLRLD